MTRSAATSARGAPRRRRPSPCRATSRQPCRPSTTQRRFADRMRSTRAWQDVSDLFRRRRARPVARWERWLLGILLFIGLQSVIVFAFWWFRIEHVANPMLFALLSLATWYGISRMVVGWYNFFH